MTKIVVTVEVDERDLRDAFDLRTDMQGAGGWRRKDATDRILEHLLR